MKDGRKTIEEIGLKMRNKMGPAPEPLCEATPDPDLGPAGEPPEMVEFKAAPTPQEDYWNRITGGGEFTFTLYKNPVDAIHPDVVRNALAIVDARTRTPAVREVILGLALAALKSEMVILRMQKDMRQLMEQVARQNPPGPNPEGSK